MSQVVVCCFASGGRKYLAMAVSALLSLHRISRERYRLVLVHQLCRKKDLEAIQILFPWIEQIWLPDDHRFAQVPMFLRKAAIYDLLKDQYEFLLIVDGDTCFHRDGIPEIVDALKQKEVLLYGRVHPAGVKWHGEDVPFAARCIGYEMPNLQINGGLVAIMSSELSRQFIKRYQELVVSADFPQALIDPWMKTNDEPRVALAFCLAHEDLAREMNNPIWPLREDVYLTCAGARRIRQSKHGPVIFKESISELPIQPKIVHYVNAVYWSSYLSSTRYACFVAERAQPGASNQRRLGARWTLLLIFKDFYPFAAFILGRNLKAKFFGGSFARRNSPK